MCYDKYDDSIRMTCNYITIEVSKDTFLKILVREVSALFLRYHYVISRPCCMAVLPPLVTSAAHKHKRKQ